MGAESNVLSHEPYSLQLTQDHLKALGKEHAVDVLEALAGRFAGIAKEKREEFQKRLKNEGGLRFSDINYHVVKTSSTSGVLKSLMTAGLIVKDSESYHITDDGREALKLCKPIVDMEETDSSGNDGEGVT